MASPKRDLPKRGEVWVARLDPTQGDEIRKTRPVVVVSSDAMGMLAVKIAVPLTTNPKVAEAPWGVPIHPTAQNGLDRATAVDALQIRSLAVARFVNRLGVLADDDMDQVAASIATVVEYV